MKLFLTLCGVALTSVLSSVAVFAEDAQPPSVTPPTIVSTGDIQGTIVTAIQPWITAGLGIGIAVFCIYLGWRLIRRFTR